MVRVSVNVYNADGSLQMTVAVTDNVQKTATAVQSGNVTTNAQGLSYLMYSAQSVHDRFGVDAAYSDSFINVAYDDGQWKYYFGSEPKSFTPLPTDVLIATIGGTETYFVSLHGQKGFEHGIANTSGDAIYNSWRELAAMLHWPSVRRRQVSKATGEETGPGLVPAVATNE